MSKTAVVTCKRLAALLRKNLKNLQQSTSTQVQLVWCPKIL